MASVCIQWLQRRFNKGTSLSVLWAGLCVIKPHRLAWKQHCQSFRQINTLYIFICFLSAYECTAVCEGFHNYLNLLIACTRVTSIEKLTCSEAGVHTCCQSYLLLVIKLETFISWCILTNQNPHINNSKWSYCKNHIIGHNSAKYQWLVGWLPNWA